MISSVGGSTPWISQDYSAGAAAQRHKDMFTKLDTNGDGSIDLTELQAAISKGGKGKGAAALMKQIDTNGDGLISQDENDAFLTEMEKSRPQGPPPGPPPGGGAKDAKGSTSTDTANKIFDVLDTNKDGKVSLDELMAASKDSADDSSIQALFKKMDENGDNSISKDEFSSFLQKMETQIDTKQQQINTYDAQTQGNTSVGSIVDATV
jgi:Ca2+-binding EF-hand superfamily protein